MLRVHRRRHHYQPRPVASRPTLSSAASLGSPHACFGCASRLTNFFPRFLSNFRQSPSPRANKSPVGRPVSRHACTSLLHAPVVLKLVCLTATPFCPLPSFGHCPCPRLFLSAFVFSSNSCENSCGNQILAIIHAEIYRSCAWCWKIFASSHGHGVSNADKRVSETWKTWHHHVRSVADECHNTTRRHRSA